MLKRKLKFKKFFLKKRKANLLKIVYNFFLYKFTLLNYKNNNNFYKFSNILALTTPKRQMYFHFFNKQLSFNKIFSVGVFLKKYLKCFKFFKKSINNINPLMLLFKYQYLKELSFLFLLRILNYSKKHQIFLKKFFLAVKTSIKYLIFKKSWNHINRPKKRIKKRVYKLIKQT